MSDSTNELPPKHKLLQRVYSDIVSKQPDPVAAIMCVTMLEDYLTTAIEMRLVKLPRKIKDSILGRNGLLATFSAKIDIAFAIGLYTRTHHHDLDLIRKIRNEFAHSLDSKTFEDEPIVSYCRSLKIPREWNPEHHWSNSDQDFYARDEFSEAFLWIANMFFLRTDADLIERVNVIQNWTLPFDVKKDG